MEKLLYYIKGFKSIFGKHKNNIIKIFLFLLLTGLIYIFETNNNSSKIFEKHYAIKYVQQLFEYKLNNNNKSFVNENPNISVIIPLYNCENSIYMSILSVQKQNYKNYEIILINDKSTDNTSIVVNDIMSKDYRIKIINNKKNMGILYSRSIGVLNAIGKYTFCLDNDDLFYDEHLFENILKISENKDYDIIEFKSFYVHNYNNLLKLSDIKDSPFNNHPNNYSLAQPQLGIFPISKNKKYYSNDYHLWGKSIKTNIYKKAIQMLTEKYYSFYNCWTEDISMLFIIFNIAESFLFIGLYGIIHLDFKKSTTYTLHASKKLMSELFLLDIIIKYIHNTEENKRYIIQKLNSILKSKYIPFWNIEHSKYLNILINKILKITSLTEKEFQLLIKCQKRFKLK